MDDREVHISGSWADMPLNLDGTMHDSAIEEFERVFDCIVDRDHDVRATGYVRAWSTLAAAVDGGAA